MLRVKYGPCEIWHVRKPVVDGPAVRFHIISKEECGSADDDEEGAHIDYPAMGIRGKVPCLAGWLAGCMQWLQRLDGWMED